MADQLEAQLPAAGTVGTEMVFAFRLTGITTEDVSHLMTYVWVTAAEAQATGVAFKESTGIPTPAHDVQTDWYHVRWTPEEPGTYYVSVSIPSGPGHNAHIVVAPAS